MANMAEHDGRAVGYEALLVVSFGGPEGPDDVIPFLENVTRGRGIPRERLEEVAEHYRLFGGVSPINQQCRDLIAAVRARFAAPSPSSPLRTARTPVACSTSTTSSVLASKRGTERRGSTSSVPISTIPASSSRSPKTPALRSRHSAKPFGIMLVWCSQRTACRRRWPRAAGRGAGHMWLSSTR